MSDIVECIMDSAEHSEVDTAHILENCEALLGRCRMNSL